MSKKRCSVFIPMMALIAGVFLKQNADADGRYGGYTSQASVIQNKRNMTQHILQEPYFWKSFAHEVLEKKSWKCSFPPDVLNENLERDSLLYKDDSILRDRRKMGETWRQNDTLWSIAVLGACKELAYGTVGVFTRELEKFKVVEILRDYVDHLHYFYTIARLMEERGSKVVVYGQNMSPIHDIDKLDPVMVIGYAERFEDNQTTSLWDHCVNRHTHINSHHQGHCMWHDCCHIQNQQKCLDEGNIALPEMVCDKVSRRLQKNFKGKQSDEMWDADVSFYKGLPESWLDKAVTLMHTLKYSKKQNDTMQQMCDD